MRIARISSSALRAAMVVACLTAAVPASAQEPVALRGELLLPVVPVEAEMQRPLFRVDPPKPETRPGALMPLYGSLVALQALDVHSTRSALVAGDGVEANPAMRPIVKHGAAFVAVKAGATLGVIWASEKLWKKNRKAAVVFTSLVNVAMAAVVANNYRVNR